MIEAVDTCVRDGLVGSFETSGYDATGETDGPLGVDRSVAHGCDLVAVFDDVVALGLRVGELEG